MSANEVEKEANKVKRILGIDPGARVALVNLLEMMEQWLPGYIFTVLEDDEMPGMDGLTLLDHYEICLSDTTYTALCHGDAAARHTAAHEFGHLFLHSKMPTAYARRAQYHPHVDPEWQADRFADVFLMPRGGVAKCSSAEEVAERFSVPLERAQMRFSEINEIQGELFQ